MVIQNKAEMKEINRWNCFFTKVRNIALFLVVYMIIFLTQMLGSACWVILLVYFFIYILFTQVLGHFNAGLFFSKC